MTLELPSTIEAEVVAEHGAAVAGVLVAIDLRYAGRYYCGTLLGLTDAAGRVRLERAALERAFAEEQRVFPMDYRVPLDQCDAEAEVRLEGGAEFAARRATAVESPLVTWETARVWRAATNEGIRPMGVTVRLDRPDTDGVVRARLTVRPRAI